MSTPPAENAILLHACCGPCSIMPIQRLCDLGFAPTLYFYNPNIHPLSEYLRRREGLLAVAEKLAIPVILADQDDKAAAFPGPWLERIAALGEAMADMASRCPLCYDIRLERAARLAQTLGFTRYSSTLLYSKYQNHQAILDAGARHAGPGLEFVGEDFRSGWQEGIRLSKEWGVYRQQYCGCVLSEFDRYRSKIGM
ncbi:MAG: epoxyqueuosine reductase QueH [Humidesulfovibrio sp.]|nr:epoxyqueuosine reductase QueH [Humidesulfovibrio sp.]